MFLLPGFGFGARRRPHKALPVLEASLYPGVNFDFRTNTERALKPREIPVDFGNPGAGIAIRFASAGGGSGGDRYSADPGNTASILVFSVAALNGLTM